MPTVKVNDINMYYEIYGEGEPLMILWGMSGEMPWLIEQLSAGANKKYKVITFDCRGMGRTDKPDVPYSLETMAGDTVGLMDAIGIERAHFLAISMGSRIALAVAAKHPEKVKSLVLNVAAARALVKEDPQTALSYERLRAAFTQPAILAASGKYPPTVKSFLRLFEALKEFDGRGLLGDIKAPTLIVNGTKDASTPVKCAEELSEGISGARLILVEEDHMFQRTKPELLLKPALEFWAEVDANSA